LSLENVTQSSTYRLTVSVEGAEECASKTDEITIEVTEIKSAGENGTLNFCGDTTPTNELLFNSLNGNPTPGGTWSNVGNVYTYTVAPSSPCTLASTATVTLTFQNCPVDLVVEKTSFEAEIFEGDEFEYEIRLTNTGGSPARNVVLVDDLPNGITYLSSTIVSVSDIQIQIGTPTVTGSQITWNIPFLPADGVVVIRIKVQAGDAGTITNLVGVSSDEDDTNGLDNQDNDVNQILPFRIPNVITPNQDGDNDSFEINGLGNFESNEIVIFNRYGDHVFEKKDYQNDWDARGQVAGTYYYILTTVDKAGKSHVFKGWIQVIKNE